jgi:hypothetical protein
MNHEQFTDFKDEMKSHIETVIQAKVNGKIDKLTLTMKENSDKMNEFISRADPAVKVFENLNWLKKSIIGIVVFIAALAGGMAFIQQAFVIVGRLLNPLK